MSGRWPRRALRSGVAVLLVALAAACDAPNLPPGSVRVDTLDGGAVLVRNGAPSGLADTLSSTFEIGSASGPVSWGRIGGMAHVSGGGLAVLDELEHRVLVFDGEGRRVAGFGQAGQGPSELETPLGIAVRDGGTLWIPDSRNARYTVFEADGTHAGTWQRTLGYENVWRGTFLPDGRLLEFASIPSSFDSMFFVRGLVVGDPRTTERDTIRVPYHPFPTWGDRGRPESAGAMLEPSVPFTPRPRADSLRALLARDLPNPPGERARSSNINYSLARTVIEEVSGRSYLDFVRERMLTPIGITGSTLVNQPGDAFAHRFDDPVRGRELVWDFNDDAGAYGWYMSAMDLARWGDAILRGRVVPDDVVRRALSDSLGWSHASTAGGPAYVHQGQWIISDGMGVRTGLALLPDSAVAVLFLNTNVPYSPTRLLVGAYDQAVPTFAFRTDERRQRATVHMTIPASADEVRYTIDGREPTAASSRYEAPISVSLPARIRARSFVRGEPWGFVAEVTLEAPRPGDP